MTLCILPSCRTHEDVEPGAQTCGACREHLTRQLGEIEQYLTIVTAVPARSGGFGPGRPGFASTPPARLDVIAMLDPRTELNGFGPDDVLDEVPNVHADLDGWAAVLVDDHVEATWPNHGGAPVLLRTNIGWICRQAWVDGFAADVGRVHAVLARACGDTPQKALGRCLDQACGGPVFRRSDDPRDGRLQCRACRTTYDGLDLVKIRSADV